MNHGMIIFDISYPENKFNGISGAFLPNKMELLFDSNYQMRYNIKSPMNLYSLNFIINKESDSCQTHLRFIDKSLSYKMTSDDFFFIFENDEKYECILQPNETKKIIGFNCSKAILYDKSKTQEITAYYTQDISLKGANSNTPFLNIPGVVLEFSSQFNNITLHFLASEVTNTSPSPEEFSYFINTKQSSEEEILNLITTMLQASL